MSAWSSNSPELGSQSRRKEARRGSGKTGRGCG
jgi:hypothetical protein